MLYPWTALATLAALLVYFYSGLNVAQARAKYGVKVPATTGDPGFERAFRAQQNTLEWLPLFLPSLWLFAAVGGDHWAAGLGVLWALARLAYVRAYSADAARRSPYFVAQFAVVGVLWVGALVGVVRSLV
jgi:glutathione S-transferase